MEIPRQGYWVGSHFFLQGIFPTQGLNPSLLHWQVDSLPLSHLGSPGKCLKEHEVCLIYPVCFSPHHQGFPPCHKSVCWGSHQILHGSGKLWTSGKCAVHLEVPSVLSWSKRRVSFWKTDSLSSYQSAYTHLLAGSHTGIPLPTNGLVSRERCVYTAVWKSRVTAKQATTSSVFIHSPSKY